ncbi:hypothetical protein TNCT_196251 [Trichonephila clavata]|uniref:Uncharacterized protein n=1 Tax=Trichonephila clavata TaxID=2740835 RepID=A0A8X6I1R7_TRICU|nr:hypothetical protein TNCT_196251 [Trichonephila clavata]
MRALFENRANFSSPSEARQPIKGNHYSIAEREQLREQEKEPISDNGFQVTAMSIKVKPRSLRINKMLTFTGWEGRDKMWI